MQYPVFDDINKGKTIYFYLFKLQIDTEVIII